MQAAHTWRKPRTVRYRHLGMVGDGLGPVQGRHLRGRQCPTMCDMSACIHLRTLHMHQNPLTMAPTILWCVWPWILRPIRLTIIRLECPGCGILSSMTTAGFVTSVHRRGEGEWSGAQTGASQASRSLPVRRAKTKLSACPQTVPRSAPEPH